MKHELLARLLADRSGKRPVVLATELATGRQRLLHPGESAGADADQALLAAAKRALARDACALHESSEGSVFLRPFNPPVRMIVVGAVHIAQPLAAMAAETGYEVTVVDPRSAFATQQRFPGLTLCTDWPDEALASLSLDVRCAVVTLTHDPKLDDPALASALASDAFYIGALGSRKTQAARLERLRARGFDDAALARIRGPVGLAIGARSPAEIAVSILAEVTQQLREGGG